MDFGLGKDFLLYALGECETSVWWMIASQSLDVFSPSFPVSLLFLFY